MTSFPRRSTKSLRSRGGVRPAGSDPRSIVTVLIALSGLTIFATVRAFADSAPDCAPPDELLAELTKYAVTPVQKEPNYKIGPLLLTRLPYNSWRPRTSDTKFYQTIESEHPKFLVFLQIGQHQSAPVELELSALSVEFYDVDRDCPSVKGAYCYQLILGFEIGPTSHRAEYEVVLMYTDGRVVDSREIVTTNTWCADYVSYFDDGWLARSLSFIADLGKPK